MPLFNKKSSKSSSSSTTTTTAGPTTNTTNSAAAAAAAGGGAAVIPHSNGNSVSHKRTSNEQQKRQSSSMPSTDTRNNGEQHKSAQQQQQQQQQSQHNTVSRPQLIFHCQLAHGSPTGLISGFSSVKELYQKIAECYEFPVDEILFCTLNSHKLDMTKLLGGQIGLDDFIFAHRKGRPKEIELVKSEDALGLTITDNGAGYSFIKRIKDGSIVNRIPHIHIGDHIEKLNGINTVGKRHFEVARMLKDIPINTTFTIRLVEPMKSGFQEIQARHGGPKGIHKKGGNNYGSGKETLRFKANGNTTIENEHDESTQVGVESINSLLDAFMGINDTDLATQIWELGINKTNSMDFAEAIDNSDLEAFGFTDDFIIELWGAVTDARQGRHKR